MKSFLSIIALVILLSGCKKGEDDPFLSLRTRDHRIVGKWVLTEMTYRNAKTKEFDYFDGTNMTIQIDGQTVDQYPYSYNMILAKDNSVEFNKTSDGDTLYDKQTWKWLDSGKKKSGLFFPQYNSYYFRIKRLTNKELVIVEDLADPSYQDMDFNAQYLEKKFIKK